MKLNAWAFRVLLLVMLLAVPSLATEPEFFGHYSQTDKSFSLEFDWSPAGISQVKLNDHAIPGKFDVVTHGVFGSTAFNEIRLEQTQTRVRYVQLLILIHDGKVGHVSAVYGELRYSDRNAGRFEIQMVKTFPMKFTPRSDK